MKPKAWVVISNCSVARIFTIEEPGIWAEKDSPVHAESRLKMLDLTSDKPGRGFDSMGEGRHAMEQQVSPKDKEDLHFAKQLCEVLEKAHSKGEIERLYVAAGPTFLGILRQTLKPNISDQIALEINKDLTHLTVEELKKHFPYAH